jgi:MOSC domain-containing protein YiiM
VATIQSIQIGRIALLGPQGVPSGFVKQTVTGAVQVKTLGVEGDEQADLSVHGGPDKAVYFYASEHYFDWIDEVPRHKRILHPGAFGENITCIGLDEKTVAIGDVFEIGSTRMQVTQPRQPCFKLGLRFADNSMGKRMMQTGRSGWYVRVLQEGEIIAGDEIRVVERPNPKWSITRFNRFIALRGANQNDMKELATLPGLAEGWRLHIRMSLE